MSVCYKRLAPGSFLPGSVADCSSILSAATAVFIEKQC
ncbi:MAG: hypothetical protein OFPI_23660 [Osedax symbiont Rs2]|nr:MAG: hypothetical protein OFPI_23660 [Osedax symbiont Rs2]